MITQEKEKKFKNFLYSKKWNRSHLIELLQKTQEIFEYLPEEALEDISRYANIPLSKIYGVATFYSQFRLNPPGKHMIRVCNGTACHVKGSPLIIERIEKELGIKNGETTKDGLFTLEAVACLGACGLAPVVMIDNDTYGKVDPSNIPEILSKYK